jgi:hypothetical protein
MRCFVILHERFNTEPFFYWPKLTYSPASHQKLFFSWSVYKYRRIVCSNLLLLEPTSQTTHSTTTTIQSITTSTESTTTTTQSITTTTESTTTTTQSTTTTTQSTTTTTQSTTTTTQSTTTTTQSTTTTTQSTTSTSQSKSQPIITQCQPAVSPSKLSCVYSGEYCDSYIWWWSYCYVTSYLATVSFSERFFATLVLNHYGIDGAI